MAKAGTNNPDNAFAPNARYGTAHMKYVVDNITAHVAPGGLSLTNASTLAEIARIKTDGGEVMTFATRPEAAKLAYTDNTNSSKVHVVDLSGGSLNDVSSVGALEVSFPVKHLAFSLDGALLLTVGASVATLWRWEEGTAVQHETLAGDEVGVGASFCPGLETPTFVVAGPSAARFIQLSEDDDQNTAAAAAAAGAGRGRLQTTRVTFPPVSSPVTSFCWSRKGLWLGLSGGRLGLAELTGTTGAIAPVKTVSADGCFGEGEKNVITQLEACLDGGCLVAVNGGATCYWINSDASVAARAKLGDDARSLAMPPGAGPGTKNLYIVAALETGAFARVPAWPASTKTNDLTEEVIRLHPAATAPGGIALDADGNPIPCPGKVCANCRTQKTPLWRNGPLGPKTLCNACGVRYKLGKLPPPGGFPPGHVPPPAPPRKRPALLTANGNPLKRQKGEKKAGDKANGKGAGAAGADGKKKRRTPAATTTGGRANEGPHGEYARLGKIGKGGGVLTDYDGAVLLMVLAGMYRH